MITETSVSDNTTIERYIDLLVDAFGIPEEVQESSLKPYFDSRNFPKLAQYIRNTMKVFFHLNIKSYNESGYADETSLARILLPNNLHRVEKQFQVSYHIELHIKDTAVAHFPVFVQGISHEIAHLVLCASEHQLKHSEVATDLCTLVFGFGQIIQSGKQLMRKQGRHVGYLTDKQFDHAMWYLKKLRYAREGKVFTTPPPSAPWWKKLIAWITST